MPTVYDLAKLNTPRTIFGHNALDKNLPHFAMITMGSNNGIITEDGAILYDGKKIVEEEKFSPNFDPNKTLNLFLALDKAAATLLNSNKWYKEELSEK